MRGEGGEGGVGDAVVVTLTICRLWKEGKESGGDKVEQDVQRQLFPVVIAVFSL